MLNLDGQYIKSQLGALLRYVRAFSIFDYNKCLEIVNYSKKFDGWMGDSQCLFLYSVGLLNTGKLLEIGTFKGKSTACFCAGSDVDLEIYCIDPFDNFGEYKNYGAVFEKNLKKMNHSERVYAFKGLSNEFFNKFSDDFFNVIFIDGHHSYENVKGDIINWHPKLKANGLMFGHDYPSDGDFGFDELKLSVDTFVKNNTSQFKNFGNFCGFWGAIKI